MTKIPSVEEKSQSEEWGAWKFVSEMFDVPHPDKDLADCGIYNASKCYEQIHDFVVEQKAKARLALLTELREWATSKLEETYVEEDGVPVDTYGYPETHNQPLLELQAHLDELIKSNSI